MVDFVNHWCYKRSITTLTGGESLNIIRCLSLHKSFCFPKTIIGVLVIAVLTVSCASRSGPSRQGGNLWCDKNCIWKTKWTYTDLSRINGNSPNDYYVKGSPKTPIGYQIPVGLNKVEVKTLWTNQFTDHSELPLDVKEGRSYVVFAYELEQGQDPNTAAPCVAPPTYNEFWEGSKKAMLGGLLQGLAPGILFTAPVWLPIYYPYKHEQSKKYSTVSQDNTANTETQPIDNATDTIAQPPVSTLDSATKPEDTTITPVDQSVEQPPAPTARPFDGCCYVWIEDAETKEVVAGTRPSGLNK